MCYYLWSETWTRLRPPIKSRKWVLFLHFKTHTPFFLCKSVNPPVSPSVLVTHNRPEVMIRRRRKTFMLDVGPCKKSKLKTMYISTLIQNHWLYIHLLKGVGILSWSHTGKELIISRRVSNTRFNLLKSVYVCKYYDSNISSSIYVRRRGFQRKTESKTVYTLFLWIALYIWVNFNFTCYDIKIDIRDTHDTLCRLEILSKEIVLVSILKYG